jgi:peroxin-4
MDFSRSRLTKELVEVSKAKDKDILLQLEGDDLHKWIGYIKGPPDSAYKEGWFKLKFDVGANYPQNPPKVKFITRVYHPNVHFETGEICLEVLKPGHWTAQWTLESVTRAIVSLL